MQLYEYLSEKSFKGHFQNSIKKKQYSKGEYIYQPHEMLHKVFEVTSGVVKIGSYTPKGEDVCYDFICKREVIGNLRYQDEPFAEFAKAMTELEVISYDLSLYKQFMVHDPLVSEWFCKSMISRRCRMESRLINIYSLNPTERVLNLFQEFDKTIICTKGKKIWVPDLFTDKDIAQLTGLTRQTVSKILKSLCHIDQKKTDRSNNKTALQTSANSYNI